MLVQQNQHCLVVITVSLTIGCFKFSFKSRCTLFTIFDFRIIATSPQFILRLGMDNFSHNILLMRFLSWTKFGTMFSARINCSSASVRQSVFTSYDNTREKTFCTLAGKLSKEFFKADLYETRIVRKSHCELPKH